MNKNLLLIVALVTVGLHASQRPGTNPPKSWQQWKAGAPTQPSKPGINPPRRSWQGWGKTERRQEPQGPRYERNIPDQTRDMSTPPEKRAPRVGGNGTRKGHRSTESVAPDTQDRTIDVMPPQAKF